MLLFQIETHIPPAYGDYIFEKDERAVRYNQAQCTFLHNQSYECDLFYLGGHPRHRQYGLGKSKYFFSAIVLKMDLRREHSVKGVSEEAFSLQHRPVT